MKRGIFFLLVILITNCTLLEFKKYQNSRAKWKGIIYEGIGVDGVMLGDSSDLAKKILGKPEFVWTNESHKYDFISKYVFGVNTCLWDVHDGYYTLYLTNQKKIVIASNPMFNYSSIYYNRGITLFFDEYDKVVEIIVLFENPIHRMEIKGNTSWSKTEYKSYIGKLWYGNIAISNSTFEYLTNKYNQVLPVSKWKLDTSGYSDNPPYDKIVVNANKLKMHIFDGYSNKIACITMISPIMGVPNWYDNPWGDGHVEEALERRKKYIKEYGYKYY